MTNATNPIHGASHDADADADADRRRRGRRLLLLVFAVFFGTMMVAGVLRFSGWHPAINKNKGELLQPPIDLRARTPGVQGGGTYAWNPGARMWRILVVTPAGCDAACTATARDVDVVRRMLASSADHLDVLWLCADEPCAAPAPLRGIRGVHVLVPDPALRDALGDGTETGAGAAHLPVYVVDPNGFVILRYAPGTDLAGLRQDLSKLLKLI